MRQIEHDGCVGPNVRRCIGRHVKLCHEAGHFRVFPVPVRIDARRLRVRRRETNELIARGRTTTHRDPTKICRRTRTESEETVLRVRVTLRGVNDHLTRRFYVYVTIRVRSRRTAQTDATVDVKRLLWGRGGDPNLRIGRDREPRRRRDTVRRIQRREQTERVRVVVEPHPDDTTAVSDEREMCLIAGTRAIARQLNHAVITGVQRGIEHVERRFRGIRGRRRDLAHRTVAHERRRIHRERTLEMGIRIDDQITTDGHVRLGDVRVIPLDGQEPVRPTDGREPKLTDGVICEICARLKLERAAVTHERARGGSGRRVLKPNLGRRARRVEFDVRGGRRCADLQVRVRDDFV